MAVCDLTTLTSNNGEGFPNSVAESMACGVPCIVTDIGDSAAITGNFSAVVPPENPEELARAWKSALRQDQATLENTALASRASIIDRYSPAEIAQNTLLVLAHS